MKATRVAPKILWPDTVSRMDRPPVGWKDCSDSVSTMTKQGRNLERSVPIDEGHRNLSERRDQAPYLSNMRPLACIRRMRYLASKMPREPELAPVSVKRDSLSLPLISEWMSTGWGCQE